MVPDLVAEMAERGAVQFAHVRTHALALHIVALFQCDGDQTFVVTGKHPRLCTGFGEEIES